MVVYDFDIYLKYQREFCQAAERFANFSSKIEFNNTFVALVSLVMPDLTRHPGQSGLRNSGFRLSPE